MITGDNEYNEDDDGYSSGSYDVVGYGPVGASTNANATHAYTDSTGKRIDPLKEQMARDSIGSPRTGRYINNGTCGFLITRSQRTCTRPIYHSGGHRS